MEIVDRKQHEAAGGAQLHRFLDHRLEHLADVPAVHLAGERIEAREIGQPLLALMALVDHAHHAVRADRPAVAAAEPAPGVLDPELALAAGIERILQLVGNA